MMATIEHCLYCFETLWASMENREPMSLSEVESSWESFLTASKNDIHKSKITADRRISQKSSTDAYQAPLFVTWNTVSLIDPTHVSLRGCIGTFDSAPLEKSLSSYSLMAALRDPRFPPITCPELPTLSVSVTILTDFETCKEPLDWTVGVHGIRVNFTAYGEDYNACYLPDVALEQGWNNEQCIISCMQKSGWNGDEQNWSKVADLKVTRFQGSKKSLKFEEWNEWDEWNERRNQIKDQKH